MPNSETSRLIEMDIIIDASTYNTNPLFTAPSDSASISSHSLQDSITTPLLKPYQHHATPSRPPHIHHASYTNQSLPPGTVHCPLCNTNQKLSSTVLLSTLKQRLIRSLKRLYPHTKFTSATRVCIQDLHALLHTRVEDLLSEDSAMYAKLQDDTMKDLVEYERTEVTWQDQFDRKRTVGERAADNVAKFGGSWKFVLALLSVLIGWMMYGVSLSWDPYPFIALNLVLSMVAAFQAPIILMSQLRTGQKDRQVNDFISTIILRAENQTRHVNAKMDHLQTHQWKRLLEIQEIQGDVLQILQVQQQAAQSQPGKAPQNRTAVHGDEERWVSPTPALRAFNQQTMPVIDTYQTETQWTCEIFPDDHARLILRSYFDKSRGMDDEFIFAHWHTDGDNFTGRVVDASLVWVDVPFVSDLRCSDIGCGEDVQGGMRSRAQKSPSVRYTTSPRIEHGYERGYVQDSERVLESMEYTLELTDASATMDDLFSGEGTVTLRNDFEVDGMHQHGRISTIEIVLNKKKLIYQNGDLPERYKPSFALKRSDRVCEFWKVPLESVKISYIAPFQVVNVRVDAGKRIVGIKADVYPVGLGKHVKIYARKIDQPATIGYPPDLLSATRTLEQISTDAPLVEWRVLYEGEIDQNNATRTNAYFHDSVSDTVAIEGGFEQGVYSIYCLDCRIVFRGVIVDV